MTNLINLIINSMIVFNFKGNRYDGIRRDLVCVSKTDNTWHCETDRGEYSQPNSRGNNLQFPRGFPKLGMPLPPLANHRSNQQIAIFKNART